MVEMEDSPPRRRETFSSLQLQRAADQLQDAIQSVRQRRSMHSSRSTSLSLMSDSSGDEEDVDDHDDSDEDQENQHANGTENTTASKLLYVASPDSKPRRFSVGTLASKHRSGASLSLKDLHASPLRPPRDLQTMKLPTRGNVGTRTAPITAGLTKSGHQEMLRRTGEPPRLDATAHKAFAVLQTELEDHAKDNRAMEEQTKQLLMRINAFVMRSAGNQAPKRLEEHTSVLDKPLTVATVQQLSDGWLDALERWKDAVEKENEDRNIRLEEATNAIEEEKEAQEVRHESELEALQEQLDAKCTKIDELQEQIAALYAAAESAKADKNDSDRDAMQKCEHLQMENEDLRGMLATVKEVEPVDEPSAEQQQRHVLNLLAQLKQAELRELQWEMLFEEQCQETSRAQEQLAMLLEDVRGSAGASPRTASTTGLHCSLSSQARRASFASSTTSSELQLYQQRIEFLEDQLRDVRDQINCDHHQFLYEQQKWEVEKKSMGHEVDEVHGVSVKVLKLLLIREKLLKRQETKLAKRVDKLKLREQSLQQNLELLQVSLDTAMQECAVALLYVRQLAMTPPTGERTAQEGLPLKPIKIVRLLKRLKSLQQELTGDSTSFSDSRSSVGPQ